MKKLLSLFLVLALAFSLCVGVLAEEPAGELAGEIVILHTNDVHGAISSYAKVAALKADYEAKEKIYNELSSQKTGEDKVIAAVDKALEKVRKTPVPTRKAASAEDRDDDDSSVIKTI